MVGTLSNGATVNETRTFNADVTGGGIFRHVQTVGTSEEAVVPAGIDLTAGGLAMVTNLDSTNFVEVRPATGVADLEKILPGESQLVRYTTTGLYAIANTSPTDVEFIIVDL